MSSIRPHGTVNVTFFRGITAGLNVLSGVEAINDSVLTLLYFQQERKLLLVSKTGIWTIHILFRNFALSLQKEMCYDIFWANFTA